MASLQLSAQRSLELHGRELQPGMKLSVLISDPERKKDRTDVNKNAKEVHVSQLAKSVTEDDLRKLFASVCAAFHFSRGKEARLMSDSSAAMSPVFVWQEMMPQVRAGVTPLLISKMKWVQFSTTHEILSLIVHHSGWSPSSSQS